MPITNHNISLVYDSINDLINANDGIIKPGMVVQTLGYNNKGDCASGIFYVESTLGFNENVDNGTIFQSEYTVNNNERLYFKRIFDRTLPVSVSLYGAVGDGVTDDSDAINRCVANNNNIIFELGKTYKISESIKIINKCGVIIDCNNATIIRKSFSEFETCEPNTQICNYAVFEINCSTMDYGTFIMTNTKDKIVIKNFKSNLGYSGYRHKDQRSYSVIKVIQPVCEVEFDNAIITNNLNSSPIVIHSNRSSFTNNDRITLKNITLESNNTEFNNGFDPAEFNRYVKAINIQRDNVYLENIKIHNFNIGIDIENFDVENIEINGLYFNNEKMQISQYIIENDNTETDIPVPNLEAPSILSIFDRTTPYRCCCIRYLNNPTGASFNGAIKKMIIKNVTTINSWAFLMVQKELYSSSYLEFENITHTFNSLFENSGLHNSYFIYSISTIDNDDVYKMRISNSKLTGLSNILNLFSNSSCNFEHVCENSTFKNYFSAPVDSGVKDKLYRESYDKSWITKPYSEVCPSTSCIGEVILKPYNKFRNLYKSGYGAWYIGPCKSIAGISGTYQPSINTSKFIIEYGNTTFNSVDCYNNMPDECFSKYTNILVSENDINGWLKLPTKIEKDGTSTDINIKNITSVTYRPFAYSKNFSGKLCKNDSTYGREKLISNDIRDLPNPGDMYAIHVSFGNAPNNLKITVKLKIKYKAYVPVFYDFNEPEFRSFDPNDGHKNGTFDFSDTSTIFGSFIRNGDQTMLFGGKQIGFNTYKDENNRNIYVKIDETFDICTKTLNITIPDLTDVESNSSTFYNNSITCCGTIPSDAFDILMQNKITELYNSILGSFDNHTRELILKSTRYSIDDFVLEIAFDSSKVTNTTAQLNEHPLNIFDVFISKCDPADSIHFFKEDYHNISNLIYTNDYYTDCATGQKTAPNFNYRRMFHNLYKYYSHMVNVSPTKPNSSSVNPIFTKKSFRVMSVPWISNIVPYHKTSSNDVYAYMNREVRNYSYGGDILFKLLDIIPQPNGFSVKRMSNNNDVLLNEHKYPEIRKRIEPSDDPNIIPDTDDDYCVKYFDGDTYVSLIKINKYYFKKKTTFYFNALITANTDIADDYTGKLVVRIDGMEVASYTRDNHTIKYVNIEPGEHSFDINVMFLNGNTCTTYRDVEMRVKNFYITENPEEKYFYRDIKYNEYYKIPIYKNGIITISPSNDINTNIFEISDCSQLSVNTGRGQLYVSYPCTDDEYNKYLCKDVVLPISVVACKDVHYGGDPDIFGCSAVTLTPSNKKVSIYPYIYPTNCSETNITYELTEFNNPENPCCKITNGFIERICSGTAKVKISIGNSVSTSVDITCT